MNCYENEQDVKFPGSFSGARNEDMVGPQIYRPRDD